MQEVAMLEADAAKAYSQNQQLNKQQVAVSSEVCLLHTAYFQRSQAFSMRFSDCLAMLAQTRQLHLIQTRALETLLAPVLMLALLKETFAAVHDISS